MSRELIFGFVLVIGFIGAIAIQCVQIGLLQRRVEQLEQALDDHGIYPP